MPLSTTELLGLIGIAVVLAIIVGAYMILSRKNRWM
jgi:hypothetical protein